MRGDLVQADRDTVFGVERCDQLAVGGEDPRGLGQRLRLQFVRQLVEVLDGGGCSDTGYGSGRDQQACCQHATERTDTQEANYLAEGGRSVEEGGFASGHGVHFTSKR